MAKAQVLRFCTCLVFAFGVASQAAAADSGTARCGDGGGTGAHVSPARLVTRLVFRDRPLNEVAADISGLGPRHVISGPRASKLRFSGVLTGSDQAEMTRKITLLTPVFVHCENGIVVLRVYP